MVSSELAVHANGGAEYWTITVPVRGRGLRNNVARMQNYLLRFLLGVLTCFAISCFATGELEVSYRRGVRHQVVFGAARLYGRVNPDGLVDGRLLHSPRVRTLQHDEGSWFRGTEEVTGGGTFCNRYRKWCNVLCTLCRRHNATWEEKQRPAQRTLPDSFSLTCLIESCSKKQELFFY